MHRQQAGHVMSGIALVHDPRAQQPTDVIRELGSRVAPQPPDLLLQHGMQQRIGCRDLALQVASRKHESGALLVEPDRCLEMAPIGFCPGRDRARQEHFRRAPV